MVFRENLVNREGVGLLFREFCGEKSFLLVDFPEIVPFYSAVFRTSNLLLPKMQFLMSKKVNNIKYSNWFI